MAAEWPRPGPPLEETNPHHLRSCMQLDPSGFRIPECDGAAIFDSDDRCTCTNLTGQDHEACVALAHRLLAERGREPCHDCAFLPGSPETQDGTAAEAAEQSEPFRCHQGMPLDLRGKDGPEPGNYAPADSSSYPVCVGWARVRAAYRERMRKP